jgi:hypothetical protein
MSRPFSRLRRGGRGVIVAALGSLALASGVVAGAPAASASTNCQWQPLSLQNGWQSEQSVYDSGDPAYCIDSGYVYLSGSLAQPSNGSDFFAQLPQQARPASNMYLSVYTYGGTTGAVTIYTNGAMYAWGGKATSFTSLAGVTYPAPGTAETPLTPLNGWQAGGSQEGHGPSYYISNGVVYLDGAVLNTGSLSSPFAVLPPAARPTHALYLTVGTGFTNNYSAVLEINPDGTMYTYGGPASVYNNPNLWTVFSGISFEVGE